jgi:ATP-dependent DNA helicase DinG
LLESERALGKNGRLTRALPNFTARASQLEMASQIETHINSGESLIVEAGTGTGKTFAYLIPCLLKGKKTILSTGTKNLQDQLFEKDLPMLIQALGTSCHIQILKGRANYLCRYRIKLNAVQGSFYSADIAQDFTFINDNISRVVNGDISEFPEISENSAVWPHVTSTVENCLGGECAYYDDCFLVNARKKALKADVVVINHHLYFADSMLKQEGFGEILPGADIIVFDEAHQLSEIASSFYGQQLSTRQINELLSDSLGELTTVSGELSTLDALKCSIEKALFQFKQTINTQQGRIAWHEVKGRASVNEALTLLHIELTALCETLSVLAANSNGLLRCYERSQAIVTLFEQFTTSGDEVIRWLELFKTSFVLHITPLNVKAQFNKTLSSYGATHIFTSATLSVNGDFSFFTTPLGIDNFKAITLDSPFNYDSQALIYLPRGMPDPKENDYIPRLIDNVIPLINQLKGRTFILFTSYRALNQARELLEDKLLFPLLVQGDEPKHVLLKRFKQLGNAVLLATSSFWEGVDVKGATLSCVIIDKIPFASPIDPIIKAKIHHWNQKSNNAFDEYQLPHAIIALKQGIGRLIRDDNDKGLLVLADPRLYTRYYGQRFFLSLPKMKRTRDSSKVNAFIKELEQDEVISD